MFNNLPGWLTDFLIAAVTAIVTYFSTRKKENVDIQGGELSNTQEAVKIWRELAQDMSDKVKELSDKVDILSGEVRSLRIENADLKLKLGIVNENSKNKSKGRRPSEEV